MISNTNLLVVLKSILLLVVLNSFSIQEKTRVANARIERDLKNIINTKEPRNYKNIASLNVVASYIKNELKKVCDAVFFQVYNINGNEYKNVIGSIGTTHSTRIIIGAHYDVFCETPGADDNASGVAGLLELARLLAKEKLKYRIDFVAYMLEEPPFFRTKNMDSYKHAKYCMIIILM